MKKNIVKKNIVKKALLVFGIMGIVAAGIFAGLHHWGESSLQENIYEIIGKYEASLQEDYDIRMHFEGEAEFEDVSGDTKWLGQLQDNEDWFTDKKWMELLQDGKFNNLVKYHLITNLFKTEFAHERDYEAWADVLKSEKIHDDVKKTVLDRLVVEETSKPVIRPCVMEFIESSKTIDEFYHRIHLLMGWVKEEDATGQSDYSEMLKVCNDYLENPKDHRQVLVEGAAYVKVEFMNNESVKAYTDEEKAKLSQILRKAYENIEPDNACWEKIWFDVGKLERKEDIEWLLEQEEKVSRMEYVDRSEYSYQYDKTYDSMFNMIREMVQENPSVENVNCMIQCVNLMAKNDETKLQAEGKYLYVQRFLEDYPNKDQVMKLFVPIR